LFLLWPFQLEIIIISIDYKSGIVVAQLICFNEEETMKSFLQKLMGLLLAILVALLIEPESVQAVPPIWAPSYLAGLIEEGLAENQEIQSLAARVESLEKKVPFAGALDDPRLGLAILNLPADSFRFDREPMTQKQISIAQKFPWFGKLDLRSQKAAMMAIRQQAVLDAKRLELARKIAVAYYEYGFIHRSLEINQRLTEIVNQLLQVAETRYTTGRGLQQDVLQAQVELSKLLDEKILLEKRRRTMTDRINELLNRDRFMAVEPPTGLDFMHLQLDAEDITSRTLQENPRLRVKQVEIGIAETDVELAKKDYWPDMDFRVAYGQRDEDRTGRSLPDFVSGQVLLNIPLWQNTRQDPKLEAARKAREAAEKSHRNLLKRLPYQVDALVTEIHETQENYKLFTEALLLQADQWVRSSQSAYEVGTIEFNTMISAHLRLLRFELQADKYRFDVYQKRAELEELVGGAIN
jgi:outer membrane protein TolC